MNHAAIYVRVSTSQQAEEGHSLANQRAACTKYTEARIWLLSGYMKMPGYQARLTTACYAQAIRDVDSFEHLIIFDSTRLGREMEVNQGLRAIFSKSGVQIHSVNEGGAFDPNTVSGVFLTAIMDARAKAENLDRATKSRAASIQRSRTATYR